jgi:hypothetical protein
MLDLKVNGEPGSSWQDPNYTDKVAPAAPEPAFGS